MIVRFKIFQIPHIVIGKLIIETEKYYLLGDCFMMILIWYQLRFKSPKNYCRLLLSNLYHSHHFLCTTSAEDFISNDFFHYLFILSVRMCIIFQIFSRWLLSCNLQRIQPVFSGVPSQIYWYFLMNIAIRSGLRRFTWLQEMDGVDLDWVRDKDSFLMVSKQPSVSINSCGIELVLVYYIFLGI